MSEHKEQEMSFVSKVHFIDDIPVGDGKEDLFNIAVVYKTGTKFDIELIILFLNNDTFGLNG